MPSGKQAVSLGICLDDGPFFNIIGANLDKYEHYRAAEETIKTVQWRKQGPFVEVIFRKIDQMQVVISTYTEHEACLKARERAKEKATSNIINLFGENKPKILKVVEVTLEDIKLHEDLARAYAVYQCQIEIGIYQPLKEN